MAGLAALKIDPSYLCSSPLHSSQSSPFYPQPHFQQSTSLHAAVPAAIFCDFDGPIVDVSDRYYSTYQLGLAEVEAAYQAQDITLPLHILSKEQFWQMKQERTPDAEIALRSGLRGQEIELFLQRVRQIVNQADLLHQDRLQPGVKRTLTRLHGQGIPLILVTLRRQSQAVQLLRQFGIAHLFAQIHGASDDDAAYLNQAEHKTRLLADAMAQFILLSHHADRPSPDFAWMIGDTEADILAGQAAGIPTIALTCGIRSQTYLQRFLPTQVHSDLASAIHHLMESVQMAA